MYLIQHQALKNRLVKVLYSGLSCIKGVRALLFCLYYIVLKKEIFVIIVGLLSNLTLQIVTSFEC